MPAQHQSASKRGLDCDELIESIHVQGRARQRGGGHLALPARSCYGWGGDSARQGLALPPVQLIPITHQGQRGRGGIVPSQQPGEVASRQAQRVLYGWPSKEGGIVGMGTAVVATVGHQQPP
jgi:hypothetical protein